MCVCVCVCVCVTCMQHVLRGVWWAVARSCCRWWAGQELSCSHLLSVGAVGAVDAGAAVCWSSRAVVVCQSSSWTQHVRHHRHRPLLPESHVRRATWSFRATWSRPQIPRRPGNSLSLLTCPLAQPPAQYRACQLYKNISMLFLFPVKGGKLSTGVNATLDASCYG